MKKYWSFFRIRFLHGLQYRAAAVSGIATQFAWGAMEILLFRAFYQADAASFPMAFPALVNYIWLQQAFLALYMIWFWEMELFDLITTGDAAYELCRPIRLYDMWFVRGLAVRLSRSALRCFPVLLLAALLPAPYGLTLPKDPATWFFVLLSMVLGLLLVAAMNMVVYMSVFFTVSSLGTRLIITSLADFCSGAVVPLPFFPPGLLRFLSVLPFASVQNVPFRIFGGDISGDALYRSLALQVFWLTVMVIAGRLLERRALSKTVFQGG